MSIIIITIIRSTFLSDTDFIIGLWVSGGSFQGEILFLSFCATDTWRVWFIPLIQDVTTICHQAVGISIIHDSFQQVYF